MFLRAILGACPTLQLPHGPFLVSSRAAPFKHNLPLPAALPQEVALAFPSQRGPGVLEADCSQDDHVQAAGL